MTTDDEVREYTVCIHNECGSMWAEVPELPGLFASGETPDELVEALEEAIGLWRQAQETC